MTEITALFHDARFLLLTSITAVAPTWLAMVGQGEIPRWVWGLAACLLWAPLCALVARSAWEDR